jgi:hypothetical protein
VVFVLASVRNAMVRLSSNVQLYEYLVRLGNELRDCGCVDLADAAISASRHASGMSTEFLGESRIALRRISIGGQESMTQQTRVDLADVLQQLDAALDKR